MTCRFAHGGGWPIRPAPHAQWVTDLTPRSAVSLTTFFFKSPPLLRTSNEAGLIQRSAAGVLRYSLPVNNKMSTTTTMTPRMPLGA